MASQFGREGQGAAVVAGLVIVGVGSTVVDERGGAVVVGGLVVFVVDRFGGVDLVVGLERLSSGGVILLM
jgi:hypothetical protein